MALLEADQTPIEAASHWCMKLMTDNLTDADYAAFMVWCDEQPENRARLDDAISAWQAFDPISTTPAMIDLRGAALRDFRKAQANAHALKPVHFRLFAACAAAAVVMFAGGSLWLALKSDVYKTNDAERRVVALEDGSKLLLDGDTVVRVKYSHGQRQLWLDQGRAKFDVVHNPERPFTVTTGEKSVLATGTEFTVERLSDTVHVILYQGRVSVFQKAAQTNERTLLHIGPQSSDKVLLPGEELVSSFGSDQATVAPIEPEQTLDWERGQLVFASMPLTEAVERVNRYTRNKIRIAPNVSQGVLVSGIYKAGDVDAFVDGITNTSALTYVSDKDGYVLERKRN